MARINMARTLATLKMLRQLKQILLRFSTTGLRQHVIIILGKILSTLFLKENKSSKNRLHLFTHLFFIAST